MPEQQNPIQPISAELSSPMVLLEKSYELYKSGFKKFVGMLLVPILGAVPLVVLLMLWAGLAFFLQGRGMSIINIIMGLLGIFSVVFIIVVAVIAQAGLYILVRDASKNLSIKQAFLEGKKVAWKFFIVSFATGIFAFLWMLLLIVPGIWAAINYSFALWIFLYEGISGTDALKRSKELIKGYWWAIFGRLIFVYVLFFAIIVIPGIIIEMFPNSGILSEAWGLASNVMSFLFTPFAIIYTCFMYWDLKKAKDGKIQNL